MQKSLLKQKFEEFKIFEEEGLDKGYDKMQKILNQMNTLKIKPEPEDVNMKFLRGLPPSWSGYSSSSSTLSNAAFVSTAGSSQGNLSYQESGDDEKEEFEEYDLKHQMEMLSTTPSTPANLKQSSEQEINPTTLDTVLTLSQSKARARAATIIYKRLKKKKSSSGLDFTYADIPAGGLDSAGGLVSAGGVDSTGKVVATPSSPVTAPTAKELADQQAAILVQLLSGFLVILVH
nr:hypothetical protein [Tanacetum cinerariifolium]